MIVTPVASATPSAQPRHPGAVLAHGLHAVAAHVVEHGLAMRSIEVRNDERHVTVRLHQRDVPAWIAAGFGLDDHDVSPSGTAYGYDKHTATGRLADSGVRVALVWVQRHVAQLPQVEVIDPTPCCELCNDTGLYSPVRDSGLSVSCPMCRGGERW